MDNDHGEGEGPHVRTRDDDESTEASDRSRAGEPKRVSLGACLGQSFFGADALFLFCLLGDGWRGGTSAGVLLGSSVAAAFATALVFWLLQSLRRTLVGFIVLCGVGVFVALSVLEFVWTLGPGSEPGPLYVGPEYNVLLAIIWGGLFGVQGWSAQCAGRSFLDWRVRWTFTNRSGSAG